MADMQINVRVPDDVTAEEVRAAISAGIDYVWDVEDSEYARLRQVAGSIELLSVKAEQL